MTTATHAVPFEVRLAIGRLWQMMNRPEQPGDIEAFYKCRDIVMAHGSPDYIDNSPNLARDYGKGDVSQWGLAA